MNSGNNIHPMSLESLPTEIFLQIFTYLPLRDIVTPFFGLNSHIDSIIRLVRVASHEVKYNDVDTIKLLHLFPTYIGHLVIVNVEMVDFRSLSNLRSLTLKYGTKAQMDIIRPEHFPLLEILQIKGFHKTVIDSKEITDNLLQVLLSSNGFRRLRICTMFNIGFLVFSNTWTGSSTLHTLNLTMKTPLDYEQLRSICPRLRRLTTYEFSMDDPSAIIISELFGSKSSHGKFTFRQLKTLERLESENKIIIDVNPLTPLPSQQVPPRFNNTAITPRSHAENVFTIQARISPQTEPYCQASFLIEIILAKEYPFKRPQIILLDPVYHPSVDQSGRHRHDWGYSYDTYKPTTPLVDIIENVIHTIDNKPGYFDSVDDQCYEEYQNDYQTFYKKALELTLSYGRPRF